MNPSSPLWFGALGVLPAVAAWGSFPRRRWGAWAATLACLGTWVAGFIGASDAPSAWLVAGVYALSACFYADFVVSRSVEQYEGLEGLLSSRRERAARLAKELAEAKARSRDIETEQREVMALYGIVKGLSEALTWEDLRPAIELGVQQYLRVEEFSLFVVESHEPGRLRPLVRRRLGTSPGASWETLEKLLREKGLPLDGSHALTSPEGAVSLPVFEGGSLMGYFYAKLPVGADPAGLLAKARTFADEISFAFRRIKLFQEVEQLSQVDGLTGVYRRGVLDERLREEVLRAQTFKTSFCLMLIDIDHFKVLNDTHGHPFGDQVLQRIGGLLKAGVYETDFVARYGGEEFAVLLPRAEPAGVLRKAEALRQAVEAELFGSAERPVRVTASIGVAHFPRDAASAEALVRQADMALYQAKELGRNQVVDAVGVHRSP